MKVTFNRAVEFLDEIEREKGRDIEGKIVRCCYLTETRPDITILRVFVVAGAIVRGILIELKQMGGDIFDSSGEVPEPARKIAEEITAKAKAMGLDVRGGRFEP